MSKEKRLPNIHPGEILREDFLKPLGISQYRLAVDTGIPHSRVTDIVKGRRPITMDTALRLGRYFGVNPQNWLNLQLNYDLEEAERSGKKAEVARKVKPLDAA
jgi:antitoxin HigA-1